MYKKLFIPGPTEVRKDVLMAQTKPMIGHRMPEFSNLYKGILEKLHILLNTKNQIFVETSSGTGLMEAAVRSCVKKKALHASGGAFAELWYKISKANGKEADLIEVEWGKAVKPEMIEEKLKTGEYDTLFVTHNETSTGVINPIKEIGEMVKNYPDVLYIVDAVSSMMGTEIKIEEWGIDVVVTSSQKCFALPPGLSIAVVSDRALERAKEVENRGYYFDFLLMKKYYDERGQTPTTGAISLFYALDYILDKIKEEGIENRYKRHKEMAEYVQKWGREYFELFAEPGYESPTVTCIKNTRGISVADLNRKLGERGFFLSNGYGKLREKTFRIAHMGELTLAEIKELIRNIEEILELKKERLMKVLIADPIAEEGKEILRKEGFEVIEKIGLSPAELKNAIKGVDGIIVRSATKVRREIIEEADNLKVIGRAGIGLDNIDLTAAKERNITVLNTPAATSISVAELALGMIFACTRHISQGTYTLREGKWEKNKLMGIELYGKTVGIIGLGRIGKEMAKRCLSLGMRVIFYDPAVESFEGAEKVDLNTLYSQSDIITLHLPLTDETYHMIDRNALSKMKDGAILINCARGGIVDEDALYEALTTGKLYAAGIDVFEEEPAIGNKLLKLPNVVTTPHLGAQAKEGQERAGKQIAEKIVEFFKRK